MHLDLPSPIAAALANYASDGENHRTASESSVYRFTRDADTLFLKCSRSRVDAPLSHEATTMEWLQGKLPVPRVVAYHEHNGTEYLLTTCIPGISGEREELQEDIPALIELFAEGLRRIHDMPVDDFPFDRTPDAMVARGWERIAEGRVVQEYIEDTGLGTDAKDVLGQLEARKPGIERVVLNHGDYCLPNIMVDNGKLAGYIDFGHAGIGDPHRDYVAARYTINRNLGPEWIDPFFEALGVSPDPARLKWYGPMQVFE